MLRSIKPNRCKHCKKRMPEEKARHVLHEECKDEWIAGQIAKQQRQKEARARAAAKVERAQVKARRHALETIPELLKAAQKEFNAYIRERDQHQPCICCGRPLGDGDIGGSFDCGHYRSVGSAPHLRFNEHNAHGQRKQCNRWGAGRAVDYRLGLLARIGRDAVEILESDNAIHKWTADELRAIRASYKAKLKQLQA